MARKIIKETFKKENGQLVKYPLGADVKNVVITKVDSGGNEIIEKTLDKELDIIKKDSANAAYPSYSIENIETESLEKLTKGESISSSMRKLYKVTSKFINHLKNITSGENHIPTGGKEGDILLWSSDGQAQWGPDANTTYSNFQGATADEAGKAGLVPAPAASEQGKFLKGDGTWGSPDNAVYTQGVGISIANNQISLASNTTEKTNVGGTSDTTGLEMTIPYFSFDKYGRMTGAGTRKHTIPNSTFVGGTLTENLYFGSTDYSIDTNGDAILNTLKLKNSSRTAVLGLDGSTLKFKANLGDENAAYENTSEGNHIFNNTVSLNSLSNEESKTKVVLADNNGTLLTSPITNTELGYLSGASSNIQNQLSAKLPLSGGTLTGTLYFGSSSYYINTSGNGILHNLTTSASSGISTTESAFRALYIYTGLRKAQFAVDSQGSLGIYDVTNEDTKGWIIKSDTSQNTTINGSTIVLNAPTNVKRNGFGKQLIVTRTDAGSNGKPANSAIRFDNYNPEITDVNNPSKIQVLGYLAMGAVDGSFLRYTADAGTNYTMIDSGNYSSFITTTKSNVTNPTSGTTYMIPFHANLSETGNTIIRCNDGLRYTSIEGATSSGYSVLNLGNAVASGTAGSKYGVLKLYGTGTKYIQIKADGAPGADRTVSFPDISGGVPIIASASGTGSVSVTFDTYSFYLISVYYGGNMYYNGYVSTTTDTANAVLTLISEQGGGNEHTIDKRKITFKSSSSSYTITVKYIKIR